MAVKKILVNNDNAIIYGADILVMKSKKEIKRRFYNLIFKRTYNCSTVESNDINIYSKYPILKFYFAQISFFYT